MNPIPDRKNIAACLICGFLICSHTEEDIERDGFEKRLKAIRHEATMLAGGHRTPEESREFLKRYEEAVQKEKEELRHLKYYIENLREVRGY